ncbi:hypothetical protein ANN_15282 [Periplaneta americana]|uniref:Uncharacterized protein n=1 Tax=Periplaneta americana TaxID=6978 RepID=A0ABQ8SGV6_PERAM|nr:hypothetical protein ANN_15282 [Periplaneta americana]
MTLETTQPLTEINYYYDIFLESKDSSGRQHSLKCAKGKRCRPVCTVVQQEVVESILASSYECTMVHCVLCGKKSSGIKSGDLADILQHLSYKSIFQEIFYPVTVAQCYIHIRDASDRVVWGLNCSLLQIIIRFFDSRLDDKSFSTE